jgi:hypothetical protein
LSAGICQLTNDLDNDGLLDAEDPCAEDARNRCAGRVVVDRTKGLPIRIKAAASNAACAFRPTDCKGDVWYEGFGNKRSLQVEACTLPNGCEIGGVDAVFGCSDAQTASVFQCETSALRSSRRVVYSFDVPAGMYVVNLYFANTAQSTNGLGDRVFDIVVQDDLSYESFDQVAAAGGSGVAVVRSAVAEVVGDEGLTVALQPRVGEVAIKAIEVLSPQ